MIAQTHVDFQSAHRWLPPCRSPFCIILVERSGESHRFGVLEGRDPSAGASGWRSRMGAGDSCNRLNRQQPYLPACAGVTADRLPPALQDWLPPKDRTWRIIDAVNARGLSAFYKKYRADGKGQTAFGPSMRVALLLYAYSLGVRPFGARPLHAKVRCLHVHSFRSRASCSRNLSYAAR